MVRYILSKIVGNEKVLIKRFREQPTPFEILELVNENIDVDQDDLKKLQELDTEKTIKIFVRSRYSA